MAGEMAQGFGELAALAEDLGLVLSTYMVTRNYLLLQFQGIWCLPMACGGTRHTHDTHTYTQTNIHKYK